MKSYKVRITESALKDMESIHEYICGVLLAPEAARAQLNRIADGIRSLDTYPERFVVFESEPERSWGMRRMIVDNYIICYLIDENAVIVTDVLYGPADVHSILIERHYK